MAHQKQQLVIHLLLLHIMESYYSWFVVYVQRYGVVYDVTQ